MKRTIKSLLAAGAILVLTGGCGGDDGPRGAASYDLDALGVPRFVAVNYIDLTQKDLADNFIINKVSRFRSSDGHDYPDQFETCRSMKHYFKVPDASTAIYSPVAGVITTIREEGMVGSGFQVHIRSTAQPAFTFMIFHVDPTATLAVGDKVAEGFRLGNHIGDMTYSDIAVGVITPAGYRLISYFETLTNDALKQFTDRRPTFLADVIITKAERDAAPLMCASETPGSAFIGPPDTLAMEISF